MKCSHKLQSYCTLIIFTIMVFISSDLVARTSEIGGRHTANAIATVVCNVVLQITGPIGQAVSTVAVIFIGIGLFMGKISWGLALGIAVGMAMLFGAENVVGWISGSYFKCISGIVA